jgi:NAD-dependent deacetylase
MAASCRRAYGLRVQSAEVAKVRVWVDRAERVTVLTGAGVSTGSGIPDFRGPDGLWTKDPAAAAMFDIDAYRRDPALRVRAWRNRRDHPAWSARPNAAHAALVDLERTGRLRALVTQNIDGLHQRAGSSPELVVELHGTLFWAACLDCGLRTPMDQVLARVDAGEDDPPCPRCGGLQRSATIAFGQALDPVVLGQAVRAAQECDLFVAAGTSLLVDPAAGLCAVALRRGARLVVVNGSPTPYDEAADSVLRGELTQLLPALMGPAVTAPESGAASGRSGAV